MQTELLYAVCLKEINYKILVILAIFHIILLYTLPDTHDCKSVTANECQNKNSNAFLARGVL